VALIRRLPWTNSRTFINSGVLIHTSDCSQLADNNFRKKLSCYNVRLLWPTVTTRDQRYFWLMEMEIEIENNGNGNYFSIDMESKNGI